MRGIRLTWLLLMSAAVAPGAFALNGAGPAKCGLQPFRGDTTRYVGIPRSDSPPGALRMWTDTGGRLVYSLSWLNGGNRHLWDGAITTTNEGQLVYSARRMRNDTMIASEVAARVGDSLITTRDGNRAARSIGPNDVAVPALLSSAVRLFVMHCVLAQPDGTLQTYRFGRLTAERVASALIRSGSRSLKVELLLFRTDRGDIVARAWFDAAMRAIAIPYVEGELDLIYPDWTFARDQLNDAELRASSPVCRSGFGPGSCEASFRVCNLPTNMTGAVQPVRSVVIVDSGYSIRSDGRGPYVRDSANVRIPPMGLVGGILLSPPRRGETGRSFYADLDQPVPGDIGKPLGVIRVDGSTPGKFMPAGANYFSELTAHANTDWDQRQYSLADIPVGGSIAVLQLDVDFYVKGVLHALQMGPQPYGHCYSAGTAVYGDGTTTGTVSRPDSTRWIIDLPRGSIGRLFENPTGDPTAVNRGLYYVSMQLIINR